MSVVCTFGAWWSSLVGDGGTSGEPLDESHPVRNIPDVLSAKERKLKETPAQMRDGVHADL